MQSYCKYYVVFSFFLGLSVCGLKIQEPSTHKGVNLVHVDQTKNTRSMILRNTTWTYKEKLWAVLSQYQMQYIEKVEEHPMVKPVMDQVAMVMWDYYNEVNKYAPMPDWKIPSKEHIAVQRTKKNSFWSTSLCAEKQLFKEAGEGIGNNLKLVDNKYGEFQNVDQCKSCVQTNCADPFNGHVVRQLAGHRSDHCDLAVQMCEDCNQGGHGCFGPKDLYAPYSTVASVPKSVQLQWIKDEYTWAHNPVTPLKLLLHDPGTPIKMVVDYLIPDFIIP